MEKLRTIFIGGKFKNEQKYSTSFMAVDDGYIPFLGVALKSVIENSSKENKYEIKILYTKVSEENKNKIKAYETENVSIEFVDLSCKLHEIENKLYTRNYFSNTTYLDCLYQSFIQNMIK